MSDVSTARVALDGDLDALTDVEEHLRVIATLVQRHVPEERRAAYATKIDDIVRRSTDPNLYLAVVGEFSSGKSTFINALLRTRLLKASCVATTASVTRIRKGPSLKIAATFTDGRSVEATAADDGALREFVVALQPRAVDDTSLKELLDRLTSDPVVADRVRGIDIAVPAEELDEQIVILDTPGINAGSEAAKHHAQVTQRVLSESADCALVLMSATQAMSRTLIDFLDSHARPFLHRCIFVLAAVDRLDEAERAGPRELVRATLQEKFGLASPIVLESATVSVPLRALCGSVVEERSPQSHRGTEGDGGPATDWARWRSEFVVIEYAIRTALRRERTLIIAERLIRLLQELVAEMERELGRATAALDDEEGLLRGNHVAAIEQVLDALHSRSTAEVEKRGQALRLEATRQRSNHVAAAQQYVFGILDRAGGSIRSYMQLVHPAVAAAVQHYGRNYTAVLNGELHALRSHCESLSAEFARQFEAAYRELPSLGVRIPVPDVVIAPVPDASAFRSALAHAEELGTSDARRGDSGAVVGGTASAVLFGWIGLPAGAILGLLFGLSISGEAACAGLIFGALAGVALTGALGAAIGRTIGQRGGPDLDARKRQLRILLAKDIEAFFGEIHDAFATRVAAAVRAVTSSFATAVDRHKAQYGAAVERLRAEHEERQRAVARMLVAVRADSADLTQRAARLESLRNRLARSRVPA